MNVWLQASGAAKVEGFLFIIVLTPQQATPMSQDSAREAMHVASHDYPEYKWEMLCGFKGDEFVVHGQKR